MFTKLKVKENKDKDRDKDKRNVKAHKRPSILAHVERAVLTRQLGACAACGDALFELYDIDHIVPRCVLPRDDANALQALCVLCHARKSRLDEPALIAAHRRGERVCWTCRKCVDASAIDDGAHACRSCALALALASASASALAATSVSPLLAAIKPRGVAQSLHAAHLERSLGLGLRTQTQEKANTHANGEITSSMSSNSNSSILGT
jgi:hypothetical protein